MISEETIRQWWSVFKSDTPLTEIRILGQNKTFTGYFTDPEQMIEAIKFYDGYGIYATINAVKESCYGRSQRDKIMKTYGRSEPTTSDNDIDFRSCILIDIDPERPSGTNASDEEKARALDVTRNVYSFLRGQGFNEPVVADSANGYHLYYRVDLANSPENEALVKEFLQALDMLYSVDGEASIDLSVFNASRIAKLIGTTSNKGADTADRPQRISKFLSVPAEWQMNDIAYIRKVAAMLPKPEEPSRFNGYSRTPFDVEKFVSDHGIGIARRSRYKNGLKLILDECPFNSNHKAPDAALFIQDGGAVGFKCLHNSCQHYGWRDFRLHFDPQAYDRRDYEEYRQKRTYYGKVEPRPIEPVKEDERGKKWLSMGDIKWFDPSQLISIPTGILDIDRKIMGFTLGDVTILSGLSGAGKTTLLDSFILSAAQRGYKVAAWSGELQGFRFQSWLDQMAAGKGYVRQKPGYENLYYAPKDVSAKINDWLAGKFWLYNNDYGDEWSHLFPDIQECVDNFGVNLILLDNLMALDIDDIDGEANEKQTRLIKSLKRYAKTANVHIVLVCHPRKEQSFQLLRKESIAGTANLTNLCDNLLISHRVGRDFERRAKDFFGSDVVAQLLEYQLVIEVAKNRSLGVVDHLVGLYYEPETRRIKNTLAESIIYGWNDEPTQTSFDTELDDLPPDEYQYPESQEF